MRVPGSLSLKITKPVVSPTPKEPSTPPVCMVTSTGLPTSLVQQLTYTASPVEPVPTPAVSRNHNFPSARLTIVTPASIVFPAARPYLDKTPDTSLDFNYVDVMQAMRAPPAVEAKITDIADPFESIPSQPFNQATQLEPTAAPQRVEYASTNQLKSSVQQSPISSFTKPPINRLEEPSSSLRTEPAVPAKPSIVQPRKTTESIPQRLESLPIFTGAKKTTIQPLTPQSPVTKTTSRSINKIHVPDSGKSQIRPDATAIPPKALNSVITVRKRDKVLTNSVQHLKDHRTSSAPSSRKQDDEVSSSTETHKKETEYDKTVGSFSAVVAKNRDVVQDDGDVDILARLSAIAKVPSRRRSNPEVEDGDADRQRQKPRRYRTPSPDRPPRRRSHPESERERHHGPEKERREERQEGERDEEPPLKRVRDLGVRQNFEVRAAVPVTDSNEDKEKSKPADPNEVWRHDETADEDNPGKQLYKLGYRHCDKLGIFIGKKRQS